MISKQRVIVFCFAVTVVGCGGPVSNVDQFKEDHAATITPQGRINMDSVSEPATGSLTYQTEDGSSWEVQLGKAADGTPRYNQPVRQEK